MTKPEIPRYRLSQIARVLGMSPNIVHNWLNSPQGVFAISDDDEAAVGSGGNYRLTFESALRIAILRACSEHGMPPSKAFHVVVEYMESGGVGCWDSQRYHRAARHDFGGEVRTVVVLSKEKEKGFTILPLPVDVPWTAVIGDATRGATIIDLTSLRQGLENALRQTLKDDDT